MTDDNGEVTPKNNNEVVAHAYKECTQFVRHYSNLRIDSFNPDDTDLETSELMELVSSRLKEAIEDTANTRKRLDKTLTSLEQRGAL